MDDYISTSIKINKGRVAIIGTLASGILAFRKDLIIALKQEGYEVYAFAVDYNKQSMDAVELLGATPVSYDLERTGLNPFKDIANLVSLYRKLKLIKPRIVFSYFIKPTIYGTIAASLAGASSIVSMIEGMGYVYTPAITGFSLRKRILQKIQEGLFMVSFPLCKKVLVLNVDDLQLLRGIPFVAQAKVELLGPIGLNLSEYKYTPHSKSANSNKIRFIFVGRLLEEKGIHYFLEAARAIKKKYPSAECVVIGGVDSENPSGISLEDLQRYIDDGTIIYPGFVNNVQDWLASSDVFVLPSFYREGIPRSTQEAMAMGRAVITTDSPGCRETVVDGDTGIIIPRWNSDALIGAMEYFILSPSECVRMGENGFQKAQSEYDASLVNRKLIGFLESGL